MEFHLRADLFLRHVDGQSVLFDVQNDRYFLAPDRMHRALGLLSHGEPLDLRDQAILAPLINRGLIIERRGPDDAAPMAYTATSTTTGDAPGRRPSGSLICQAIIAQAGAELQLRRRKIGGVLAAIRGRRQRAIRNEAQLSSEDIFEHATAFRASSKFFPTHGQCLRRSVALTNHLLTRQRVVDMVFGVSVRPFRAHCWVEHSGVVLNDTVEGVRRYTPILVI